MVKTFRFEIGITYVANGSPLVITAPRHEELGNSNHCLIGTLSKRRGSRT